MPDRWRAVFRALGWLWLALPLLSAAVLLLWGLWQQATLGGAIGWTFYYPNSALGWFQSLLLWLGPGLALLWAGRQPT